ncbi:hypothetical protein O6H91_16G022300 [Diphasiastrum complanatum]|uniref:Uncharacterized protein n=1 Tax=Diphasiastrum complanatum TaxID=34168 RepID=A0ACC2BAD7_DIPCM|nr:hypothetical protein O6H91_16G022300 [Diphasiastrum complanatum]
MVPLCLPCAAAGVGRLSWCAGDLTIVKKGASISIVPEFGSGFWRGYKFASCLQFTMSTQTRKTGIVASASHESIAGTDQRQWVLLRKTLGAWVKPYLEKNSLVVAALNLISAHDGSPVTYDHVAFRTFGVDGCGIDSIADFFMDFGYRKREQLFFPGKKLRAFWYSPPEQFLDVAGNGVDGPLPRIFVSEILVEELSVRAQEIIKKYTGNAAPAIKYPVLAGVLNSLPWPTPHFAEYQQLASESEYAAWTLVEH